MITIVYARSNFQGSDIFIVGNAVTSQYTSDSPKAITSFVLKAFLPLTVFYCVVLVFRINVHSTYLQVYVLYSQAITVIFLAHNLVLMVKEDRLWLKYLTYSTGTLYGVWNLDFFRFFSADICLQTGSLATVSLELVIAIISLVAYRISD